MILDPTSFTHFNELKNIVDKNYFENTDISFFSNLYKNGQEENVDWFDLDYSKENFIDSEGIGIDDDNIYIGSGKLFVCQLFREDLNYKDSVVNEYFYNFRQDIKNIPGVQSSQFYRVNDIVILEHTDELPNNNLFRMIFPLEVPVCEKSNIFGFKIGTETIIPQRNQIIFFNHSIKHSAWNLTGTDWKFISFDISADYIV